MPTTARGAPCERARKWAPGLLGASGAGLACWAGCGGFGLHHVPLRLLHQPIPPRHGPPPSGLHRGPPREPSQGRATHAPPGSHRRPVGGFSSSDAEEAWALFLTWEELGPLLAYARRRMSGKRWLPCGTSSGICTRIPLRADLRAAEVARAYRLHCCKAGCHSNYLLYLEEDVTLAVTNAARLGVGLGAVCADVVETLNAILKRAYDDLTARAGGRLPGAPALEREAEVVLQAWEWWSLKFDLPLQHHGAPHTASCTMAKLMSSQSPPASSFSSPPLALVSPIHGPRHAEGPLGRDDESPRRPAGVLDACFVWCLHFALVNFWLVSINIYRIVLMPATLNVQYIT